MTTYNNVPIRGATREDVLKFWGQYPDRTIRAYAVIWGGEVAAIAGVTIEKDKAVFFSDIKEGINPPKLTIWRASKEIVRRVKTMVTPALPMVACADNNSDKYLKRLGFTFIGRFGEENYYGL